MPEPKNWKRLALEGVVIVGSILLAFGIQAGWEQWQERDDEQVALEVLLRDLAATQDQLAELSDFMDGSLDAAIGAYVALVGDRADLDPATVSNQLVRTMFRRTARLPRAGYTDLLNTGSLSIIRDQPLRHLIIQFYESAERSETILEKNSALYPDGQLREALSVPGLVLPRPIDAGVAPLRESRRVLRDRLGPDIRHPPDPLWDLPADSRELDRVRSALLAGARNAQTNVLLIEALMSQAEDLQGAIRSSLDS